jgi:hypothetical protein
LVSVIRESSLRDDIDVKRFYAMVSNKFEQLYRDEIFHLDPIWGALVHRHAQEDLYGLFLKFEEVADNLGVNIKQAAHVAELPRNSQSAYLSNFGEFARASQKIPKAASTGHGRIPGMGTPVNTSPASGMGTAVDEKIAGMGTPVNVPTQEETAKQQAPSVSSADETEQSQRVAWAFAQALKATPAGEQINTGEIQFLISSKFDHLLQGQTFTVEPILALLLGACGGDRESLFLGLIRFRSVLISMGIEMADFDLGLDQATKGEILAQAQHQNLESFRAGGSSIDAADIGPLPGEIPKPSPLRATKKEEQLSEYSLSGQSEDSPGKRLVKRAILALLLVGAGFASYRFQPSRALSLAQYAAIFPVISVESHGGIFVGYLDDVKWLNLSHTERKMAVLKLQTKLMDDGFLRTDSTCQSMCRQVAIMDTNDKMVVFDVLGGKLKAVTPK